MAGAGAKDEGGQEGGCEGEGRSTGREEQGEVEALTRSAAT